MPLRVLLLEDDAMTAMLVESLLVEAGHFVSVAGDTDEASKFIADGSYDALIADWSVPGRMSTVEIANFLVERNSSATIVFTSGYHPEHLTDLPPSFKNFPFFQKPVDYQEVINKIEACYRA